MPTTKEKTPFQRATVPDRTGAGEPPGEPAPPPEILDCVPDDIRRQLPDEVVDELLAGAKTEEEIFGPGGVFGQLTKRLGGAGAGGRADRPPRLRAASGAAGRGG